MTRWIWASGNVGRIEFDANDNAARHILLGLTQMEQDVNRVCFNTRDGVLEFAGSAREARDYISDHVR